ncbi:hypothetical protein LLG96_05880, partial [bacterium]|nr:hypothetical protein [bacterium]
EAPKGVMLCIINSLQYNSVWILEGPGEDVPAITHFFKNTFLDVTSFACPKEVTKERAPREKPFSTLTARFSGMCELTSLRLARTAPILFPKTG